MAITSDLKEVIVVFIYLLVGAKTEAGSVVSQGPISSGPWKGQVAAAGKGAHLQRQWSIWGLAGLAILAVHPEG